MRKLVARRRPLSGARGRDPRAAARKRLDDIETFPLDERWVLPARFTRTAEQASDYPTVERGVFEEQRVIGTVTFTLDGTEHTLLVAGRPDDDTGVEGSVMVLSAPPRRRRRGGVGVGG